MLIHFPLEKWKRKKYSVSLDFPRVAATLLKVAARHPKVLQELAA